MNTIIKHGRVIDPVNSIDKECDVYISNGRIAGIGKAPKNFKADREIDAKNKIVCPGFVDLAAKLREPGEENKGTIASETRAAAASGVTTLCMSPDTNPVIDTPAVVELIHRRAEDAGYCNVLTIGALTQGLDGEHLSEMAHLKEAGCVAVSNVFNPFASTQVIRRAFEYAASCDLTIFLHAEDSSLSDGGCIHEGVVSTRLGLPGIPEAAETRAVANYLMLIEHIGVNVHFCRLSTARAIQKIGRARYDGLPITSDVAAHQLHLTEMDIGFFDSQCHVHPPLRTQRDKDALRDAIATAQIDAICSDHQPHNVDAKLAPFAETEAGISSLETLLPLSLRLVEDGLMDLSTMVQRLSATPAQILGIDAGHLGVDATADICIFDPASHWTFDNDKMISRGHNSPFNGWDFQGRVVHTLLAGKTVFEFKS